MKNNEQFKTPSGQIEMVLHKGGEFNKESCKLENVEEVIAKKDVKNLIVNTASQLMAYRMAPLQVSETGTDVTTIKGILGLQYLAVGVGILKDPSKAYDKVTNPVDTTKWDLQNPTQEQLTDFKLQGELFRKPFTSWAFVDSADAVSKTPTNILKIVTTFLETEAVGPLTEMGLFGGNASDWTDGEGKDSGMMFNYKTFAVWNKPADSRLSITWRLTF
jgi:hypothetical protein